MDMNNQARALMNRHHHLIKNRQQSLLTRTSAEVGHETHGYWTNIQGKPQAIALSYDRSNSTMS